LEKIIFENFKFSENNIISVELAKVLRYMFTNCKPFGRQQQKQKKKVVGQGGREHVPAFMTWMAMLFVTAKDNQVM
jgi:hypothetical protein